MAQDTALLRYLLRRWHWWAGWWRDLAFWFDWTDDYISSNATIGRTGYNMNVSGNVSTGSDADGSYIQFNGNRDATAGTWTEANIWWSANTTPTYTQSNSFTIKTKFKFSAFPANGSSWLFGSSFDAVININSSGVLVYGIRWSSTVLNSFGSIAINTLYDMYLVYDNLSAKFYWYLSTAGGASVLLNAGGTSWPATFTANAWTIWDSAHASWWATSANKYIYHAAIRNRALTQAEIDADIALWNTAKSDPTIVAYYIPDNLQYNTQYMTNSSDFSNASWTKTNTTVTANTTVAPDGTTTADTLTIWLWATSWVSQINTSVTWSWLASQVYIVKAFVRVSTGTSNFRLIMYQNGVATWTSADLTATTTRQEFTFTQTFTSSTSATGITWWIINESTWLTMPVLLAWNCRVFSINQTLRDESPNIWGYLWWKHQKVLSCRAQPWKDWVSWSSSQWLIYAPRAYMFISWSTNVPIIRWSDWLVARTIWTALWTWFRGKVRLAWVFYRTWSVWWTKLYINWVLVWSWTSTVRPPTAINDTRMFNWRIWSTYYQWNIRDIREYTFTWSFTNADALAIYNGGEPISSWVTKYLHYRPPVWEVWTTTQDQSTNDRDWTLNGWVTRDYI